MIDSYSGANGNVRRVYRNFAVGLLILGLTAVPCTISANRVLKTMSNAPITWMPKDDPAFSEWLDYLRRYQFVDVLFLSWPGCELESDEIQTAYQALKPFTEPSQEHPEPRIVQLLTGDQVYRSLRDPPLELSHEAACARLRKTLVGQDEKTTCLIIGVSERGSGDFDSLMSDIRTALKSQPSLTNKELIFVGPRMELDAIDRASQQSIDQFWLPSLALGIIICFLFLRSIPLTAAVLAVALSSQGWALAIVEWLGGEINAVLIVLLPLSFVLAVSSGIHLSNYYLDRWRQDPNVGLDEILDAMKMGRLPCFLAAVTTIIGLLSLWWVPLWPLQWFGTIGAFITAASLIMLWLVLPGAMHLDLLWKREWSRLASSSQTAVKREMVNSPGMFKRLAMRLQAHAGLVLLGFVAIVVSLLAGVFYLETTVDVDRMLPDVHSLKRDYTWFESNVGPLINTEIEIVFPIDSMEAFHDRAELVVDVHDALVEGDSDCGVLSAVTFIPRVPQGGKVGAVVRRALIRKRIEEQFPMIQSSGFARRENGSEFWRLNYRYPFRSEIDSSTRLAGVQKRIASVLESHPRVRFRVSGTTALAEAAQKLLFDGLIKSFLSTFLFIWLAMLLMLRSFASSVLAMLPNIFPFLTLFGAMGLIKQPLDIGIVMAASVALGIAVDDTIHFLTQYRASLAKGLPREDAVHDALKHCGVAMIQTTAICVATMFLYVFSDFIPTQKFSLLMSALLIAALIGDMIMLPALLWSRLGAVTGLSRGVHQ